MLHQGRSALEAGVAEIRRSPKDNGAVELIVARPGPGERAELTEGYLDTASGLVGDTWAVRGSTRTADGTAHPDMQLNVMNARAALLFAGAPGRRSLAGDQLFVDLDLSEENLPPGTRITLGSAVIEITAEPQRGCQKFSERFGVEALRFVNSDLGRELRLRGVNARVARPGLVRVGDLAARSVTG